MPTLRNSFIDGAWRYRIDTFAEHISNRRWLAYPWLKYLLRRVQKSIMKGNARIVINAPPRHGKSEAISHELPTWFLDWFPDKRVILASYGDKFAEKWGLAVRDEFELNPRTRTRLRKAKRGTSDWMTKHGGGMRAVSINGSITGLGADVLVIDDPHKNWEEAMSATKRQLVIDQFNSTLYTRLEPNGSIVVIQTRWHERDLSGYLISEHADDWEHINLPALAEPDDLLGRVEGEPLCPERFTAETLAQIKKGVGTHMFAGLFQQRPAPIEGNMVMRNWFRRYLVVPDSFDEILQSWDLTFGKDTGTSKDVGEAWGRKGGDFYLLDLIRGEMNFPEQCRQIEVMTKRWPDATTKLVEDAASAAAVISTLKKKVPGLVPVPARSSKEARLVAVSGLIESGNVYIPHQSIAPWADDFIEEVVTFPNAAYDDQVDSMTQALNRLSKRAGAGNFRIPDVGQRQNPWEFTHGNI